MDPKGQISAEYVLVMGFMLIIVLVFASFLGEQNELNMAMAAARSGAEEGTGACSFAIYDYGTYKNKSYETKKPTLLNPSSIKIVKINWRIHPKNPNPTEYGKTWTWYQLQIYATAPSFYTEADKDSAGGIINYYAIKSIAGVFNTTYLSAGIENRAYGNRYKFSMQDVRWI